jgi:nucleoside-diphosphate-sugar epimerase
VDDIVSIASEIIKEPKLSRKIINIANPRNISVRNLVVILEQLLGIDAKKVIVSKGENYFIDTSLITDFTTKLDIDFTNQYEQKVLEKYYRII